MFIPYEDYDEAEGRNLPPLAERLVGPEPEESNLLQVGLYWRRRCLAAEARLALYDARERKQK